MVFLFNCGTNLIVGVLWRESYWPPTSHPGSRQPASQLWFLAALSAPFARLPLLRSMLELCKENPVLNSPTCKFGDRLALQLVWLGPRVPRKYETWCRNQQHCNNMLKIDLEEDARNQLTNSLSKGDTGHPIMSRCIQLFRRGRVGPVKILIP